MAEFLKVEFVLLWETKSAWLTGLRIAEHLLIVLVGVDVIF